MNTLPSANSLANCSRLTNDYAPSIGWSLSYPFDAGSMQTGTKANSRLSSNHGDWVTLRQIDEAEALTAFAKAGQPQPKNKIGTVVEVDELGVTAVYMHDCTFSLIYYSFHNVRRLAGDFSRVHTAEDSLPGELIVWAWNLQSHAEAASAIAAFLLGGEALAALPVAPRWQPYSKLRVYVPMVQVGDKLGKVVLDFAGAPAGILTAAGLFVAGCSNKAL